VKKAKKAKKETMLSAWPTPQARDWKGPQGRWKKLSALDLPAAASLVDGAEKGMNLKRRPRRHKK
jgi:hypothetical protein